MAKVIKTNLLKRPKKLHDGKVVHYWVLRWTNTKGGYRYHSLGRTTKMTRTQAEARRDQWIVDLDRKVVPRDRPTEMTISEYLDFHEQQFGHEVRPNTIINWRSIRKYLIEALDNKPISDMAWPDFGVIREYLQAKGLQESTVRVRLSLIKTIIGRAADKGLIPVNPFAKESAGSVPSRPIRTYTEREISAMIELAPTTFWQTIIRLAYTTGLRRSELVHLQWSNLLNNNTEVRVQEQHERHYVTASGVEVPLLQWKPKSKDSTRTVPFPAETTMALLRHKAREGDSPYLFLNTRALLIIQRRAALGAYNGMTEPGTIFGGPFNGVFNAIQGKVKTRLGDVNYQFGTFHDLRGSFATRAAAAGVPLHTLARYMGHSNVKTTARYYLGTDASDADRLRSAFTSQTAIG